MKRKWVFVQRRRDALSKPQAQEGLLAFGCREVPDHKVSLSVHGSMTEAFSGGHEHC